MTIRQSLSKLLRGLGRWHRDRRATALTEFVITLPIFLLIFSAVLSLYELQDQSVKTKGVAFSKMWFQTAAYQNSQNPAEEQTVPLSAAVAAGTFHVENSRTNSEKALNLALDSGSGATQLLQGNLDVAPGHIQESYSRLMIGRTLVGGSELPLLRDPVSNAEDLLGGGSGSNVEFTYLLIDDTLPPLEKDSLDLSGWKQAANSALGAAGARPALGGGMRYGIIGAKEKRDITINLFGNRETTRTAHFSNHMLASPKPTNRMLTVLMTYLAWSTHDQWDEPLAAFQLEPQTTDGVADAPDVGDCKNAAGSLSGGDADDLQTIDNKDDMESEGGSMFDLVGGAQSKCGGVDHAGDFFDTSGQIGGEDVGSDYTGPDLSFD